MLKPIHIGTSDSEMVGCANTGRQFAGNIWILVEVNNFNSVYESFLQNIIGLWSWNLKRIPQIQN